MVKKLVLTISLKTIFISLSISQVVFSSGELTLGVNKSGYVNKIINSNTGKNYLAADTIAPLITLISNGVPVLPSSAKYKGSSKTISLNFDKPLVKIDILVEDKETHLTMQIVKAEPSHRIDGIVWGPYPLIISETIGEIIGVARNQDIAVGIQVLNIDTDGGFYSPEGATYARGNAALKTKYGCSLQAFTINRDKQRYIDSWTGQFPNTPVTPIKGKTVVGSKIAFFSCLEKETLNQIEKIELEEGLPHPVINGQWVKRAWQRGQSYLIAGFTEKNIDEMISYTKRAGLVSLYHGEPFTTWGHFQLDSTMFPRGRMGMKFCAEKAKEAGVFLGVHTLTNFITPNDPFITPVPDKNLALTGYGFLKNNITKEDKEIEVTTREYFSQKERNDMKTVKIGNELIRYRDITETSPFKLLDCQRGAFGTSASSHSAEDTVGKLYDYPYKTFFPDIVLQDKMVKNLADFFNETGVTHLDFDGFEGCMATGHGDYAVNKFALDFYNQVKHPFINGTSISKSFYWHINTYCNWGEPWYGGFKESMQNYRIDNQELFDRNLMPHMLGWYLLTEHTTKSEMQWMLARAAGYDAGFAMATSQNAIEKNENGLVLLDLIREWESARLSNAFTPAQQDQLKDSNKEFHLEKLSNNSWNLYPIHISEKYIHSFIQKQPGEPTASNWTFRQDGNKQPLRFILSLLGKDGSVSKTKIIIDNYFEIEISEPLKAGQTLVYEGEGKLILYDEKGKFLKYISLSDVPELDKGEHTINFDTKFSSENDLKVQLQIKSVGLPEMISSK